MQISIFWYLPALFANSSFQFEGDGWPFLGTVSAHQLDYFSIVLSGENMKSGKKEERKKERKKGRKKNELEKWSKEERNSNYENRSMLTLKDTRRKVSLFTWVKKKYHWGGTLLCARTFIYTYLHADTYVQTRTYTQTHPYTHKNTCAYVPRQSRDLFSGPDEVPCSIGEDTEPERKWEMGEI